MCEKLGILRFSSIFTGGNSDKEGVGWYFVKDIDVVCYWCSNLKLFFLPFLIDLDVYVFGSNDIP